MSFYISVKIDRRVIRLQVERIFLDKRFERFKVIAKNKSLILQNNRPILANKGLKYRKPKWDLIEGQLQNTSLVQSIIEAISEHLKTSENQ